MRQIKLDKISVKWRLFIYLSLFAAVTLLLLWLFQIVFLQSFYKSIKVDTIKEAANSIIKDLNSDDLQSAMRNVAQKNDVSILIADINGETVYYEENTPDSILHRLSTKLLLNFINEAKSQDGAYLKRFDRGSLKNEQINTDDFPYRLPMPERGVMEGIIYTKIAGQINERQAAVIICAIISPVNATIQTLRVQLVYVTVIMLILALLLALFISRRISKPIININNSAKELAKGNYDAAFAEDGYREIAQLGSTLNYAARELSKTEALRRELIANVSHDLRTPLTMITGYSEVMRDLPGENTQENVQIIIDEAKRLTSLVNDILDISKLQSDTESTNLTRFNLTVSIKDILKRYGKLTEQDGYSVRFDYGNEIYVKADELKISQVIYNLVNNAVNYTGEDKTVTVRQTVSGGTVRIEVIDTGEGIPEEKLKDIWDRYYKIDKVHKRAQVGTGLGLSIVKSILLQHKAKFGVQSAPGHGSVFWFELPIEKE